MRNFAVSLSLSIIASVISVLSYHFLTYEKIGYVKTGVLLQQYKGMVEANDQYNSELAIVQNNLDTLKNRYTSLKIKLEHSSASDNSDLAYQVGSSEKEYFTYNEIASKQLSERRDQLTMGVLETVNNFIESYGKQNGYRIILGTTSEGSILYGLESDDLTDKVLSELNAVYESNKKKLDN